MRNISVLRQLVTQIGLGIIGLFVILPIWGVIRLAFDGSLLSRPTACQSKSPRSMAATCRRMASRPFLASSARYSRRSLNSAPSVP